MVKQIVATYFSGTGTTKKIVETVSIGVKEGLENKTGEEIKIRTLDFSLPQIRKNPLQFSQDDLVVMGMPVIAGRLPNLILKGLKIEGSGAKAVPIVLYGNRDYQDALSELKDVLEDNHCESIAAGAFVGEHSFSKILAKGRPDNQDLQIAKAFGKKIAEKALVKNKGFKDWAMVGNPKPYFGYYKPQKEDGTPIDIRKVKPSTNDNCIGCMKCAKGCRMGAIDMEDPKQIVGTCMKCCYCIKSCPTSAKTFTDLGFIYHKEDLEKKYKERKEPKVFI